ncbi:MAG: hypothetical protein ACJATI_002380 [Halioglobus sp.]|jgi:hypothetical protein
MLAGIPEGSPCKMKSKTKTTTVDSVHITRVLLVQIPDTVPKNSGPVLMYGHWNKQAVAGEVWTEPKS